MVKWLVDKLCAAPGLVLGLLILQMSAGSARAQVESNWEELEKRFPGFLVVHPESVDFGYRFEDRWGQPALLPAPYHTASAAAIKSVKNGLAAGRIDSLIGLAVLAQMKDRTGLNALVDILTDHRKLKNHHRRQAAAIPLVLRYHLPADEWPDVFIRSMSRGHSLADSTMIACLTKFDLPKAEKAYWGVFPYADSLSQLRITNRLAVHNPSDTLLWRLLRRSRNPGVQNTLLNRLEARNSPFWPAQADSLANTAVGDVACRVLEYASATDTAVYHPLMRDILVNSKDKDCILKSALRLSADGDQGSMENLKHRYYQSDIDMRVVTSLAICRLGDTWGVAGCIRFGLIHEKYRDEAIDALETVTGLAYGQDDAKWHEWFAGWNKY